MVATEDVPAKKGLGVGVRTVRIAAASMGVRLAMFLPADTHTLAHTDKHCAYKLDFADVLFVVPDVHLAICRWLLGGSWVVYKCCL